MGGENGISGISADCLGNYQCFRSRVAGCGADLQMYDRGHEDSWEVDSWVRFIFLLSIYTMWKYKGCHADTSMMGIHTETEKAF